jgi:hypothetical protein
MRKLTAIILIILIASCQTPEEHFKRVLEATVYEYKQPGEVVRVVQKRDLTLGQYCRYALKGLDRLREETSLHLHTTGDSLERAKVAMANYRTLQGILTNSLAQKDSNIIYGYLVIASIKYPGMIGTVDRPFVISKDDIAVPIEMRDIGQ